jgi:hypothetical protein
MRLAAGFMPEPALSVARVPLGLSPQPALVLRPVILT